MYTYIPEFGSVLVVWGSGHCLRGPIPEPKGNIPPPKPEPEALRDLYEPYGYHGASFRETLIEPLKTP